jgi:ribonucleoside-diphosphate reductase alpha chain
MPEIYGPRNEYGQLIHAMKYRDPGETFDDYCIRYARTTTDTDREFRRQLPYTRDQYILPAGRQQRAVGRPFETTAFNCFVMGEIPDTTAGIFEALRDAALTMRAGGGIGMDFSTLRPAGEPVRGLGHGASASGPVSFMNCWHTMCATMMSAGERRGAMMGVLRIDHPDIMQFVRAKQDQMSLTNFNISVAVTDEFMEALENDGRYTLKFGDTVFGQCRAVDVWAAIMENNWDFAEPGVVFIDRINRLNPLYYCETISATNPCAEQALPPWGACLLGSANLVKLLRPVYEANGLQLAARSGKQTVRYEIDMDTLDDVVDVAVRAFDRVIDRTVYPLEQQRAEALAKRRMGLGVTGMANALEVCGLPYASPQYLDKQDEILNRILIRAYRTSCELAQELGPFPLWHVDKYVEGEFFKTRLPDDLRHEIGLHGLRNGLLTSIAPTGTISQAADYVSSGIEPVFMTEGARTVLTPQGPRVFDVTDYAYAHYGVRGRTANEISGEEHVDVLCRAQRYVDNSISKTCNVNGQIAGQGDGVSYEEFKNLYLRAWHGGAKSCALFNTNGKRAGILKPKQEEAPAGLGGAACFYDPATGERACAAD